MAAAACLLIAADRDDPLAAAHRLRAANNPNAALACYDRVSKPDAAIYYEKAALAHATGNTAVLESSLRACVRLMPSFGDGHFELANALHSQRRFGEAVVSFNAALAQKSLSDPGMAHNNMANTLSELGDGAAAHAAYVRGLSIAPASTFLLNGLANQQSADGSNEEAVVTIRKALHALPTAHYAAFNLGNFYRKLKRRAEAEDTYRRALAAEPTDTRYLQGVGTILHERGKVREAVAMYKGALAARRRAGAARSTELERDLSAALREAGAFREAATVARGAIGLDPSKADGYMALAHALREDGRVEEASVVSQLEARLDVSGGWHTATPDAREAVAKALAARGRSGGSGGGGGGGSRGRLAIFCRKVFSGEKDDGTWHWGPRSKTKGIGGSESAVISVAAELARIGWSVEVYANPSVADTGVDPSSGVLWLPHWAYQLDSGGGDGSGGGGDGGGDGGVGPVRVFVAWRFSEAVSVGRDASLRLLWLHDEVRPETVPEAVLPLLHGVMVLSAFHGGQLPPHARPLELRTANGLDLEAIVDGPNLHSRYIYASSASAGLQLLLQLWPQVKAALPDAELHVYYGFWPYAMWAEQPHLIALKAQIEPLLAQPGVVYHGMVSEVELAAAYASAGWYAYPSDKPETSGIALMKALACGAVPVTSGQLASALPETLAQWDLGPTRRHGSIGKDAAWQRDYVAALIAAARRPAAEMATYRREMKADGRRRFSWSSVAAQWDRQFEQRLKSSPLTPPADEGGGGGASVRERPALSPLAPSRTPPRRARKAAATVFMEVDMGLGSGGGGGGAEPLPLANEEGRALLDDYHAARRERGRLEAKVRSLEETVAWLSRPEVETCAETEGKARTRGTGEA